MNTPKFLTNCKYLLLRMKCHFLNLWYGLKNIKIWFSTIYNDKDFDFSFIWIMERKKLQQMKKYFSNANVTTSENYKQMCKYLDICLKLIDIMLEDTSYLEQEEKGNPADYNSLVDYMMSQNYVFNHYVNLRNINRFVTEEQVKNIHKQIKDKNLNGHIKDFVYTTKAKHLYYSIMFNEIEKWWD